MLAWLLEEFHILPDEGGALDQDEQIMNDIQTCWWWKMLARNNAEANRDEEKKVMELARARSG